jgi:plasmid stability protein
MAQLIVRKLDEDIKAKLRERARRHGRSTEAEVREILRSAVGGGQGRAKGLGTRIRSRFTRVWLDEDIPELRGQSVRKPDFSK